MYLVGNPIAGVFLVIWWSDTIHFFLVLPIFNSFAGKKTKLVPFIKFHIRTSTLPFVTIIE